MAHFSSSQCTTDQEFTKGSLSTTPMMEVEGEKRNRGLGLQSTSCYNIRTTTITYNNRQYTALTLYSTSESKRISLGCVARWPRTSSSTTTHETTAIHASSSKTNSKMREAAPKRSHVGIHRQRLVSVRHVRVQVTNVRRRTVIVIPISFTFFLISIGLMRDLIPSSTTLIK